MTQEHCKGQVLAIEFLLNYSFHILTADSDMCYRMYWSPVEVLEMSASNLMACTKPEFRTRCCILLSLALFQCFFFLNKLGEECSKNGAGHGDMRVGLINLKEGDEMR